MGSVMQRKLGRSGIEVSAMGLGCWAIGGPFWRDGKPVGWGEVDDNVSIQAIHCALDLGINFFDTADVYGAGHSERVLGRALAGRRHQVVLATKFGNIFDEKRRLITGASAEADHIRQACEASLRRLGTEWIDLYQLHLGGLDVVKAIEVRQTLESLVETGKIRSYAWSTDDTHRARLFAEGEHCTAVQHQMNVLEDAAAMIQVCEELGLASINRGPLAMGLLTGKYRPHSQLTADDIRGEDSPEWMHYFKNGRPNPAWLRQLDAVRQVLTSDGRTLAQGALAWVWGRSPAAIPIPGFRTAAQVEENCQAMAKGALTTAQMSEINRLLARLAI